MRLELLFRPKRPPTALDLTHPAVRFWLVVLLDRWATAGLMPLQMLSRPKSFFASRVVGARERFIRVGQVGSDMGLEMSEPGEGERAGGMQCTLERALWKAK